MKHDATFTVQCHVNSSIARSRAGFAPWKSRLTNKRTNKCTLEFYKGADTQCGYCIYYSICRQYCFVLCGLISAAQRIEAEPDSNEELKEFKAKFKPGSCLARVLKLANQRAMHNANSEGTTPRECSTKHKVRERNAQSADSTVSSFVDSSAQHRLYILYIVPSIAVVIKTTCSCVRLNYTSRIWRQKCQDCVK